MRLSNRVQAFIDKQYKSPKGILGTYFGEKMVWQHKPETTWTIDLMDVQQGDHVLELGCGSGYALKLILEQAMVGKVVGVDLSPTVIRSATIRNKKAVQNKKACLVQADVVDLPFADAQFEKAFSIHSIYFWEDLAAAIAEIHRVLKPGGRCVLTLCNGKDGEIWEGMNNTILEKIMPLMKKKGFVNVALNKGPNSRQFYTVAVSGEKKG